MTEKTTTPDWEQRLVRGLCCNADTARATESRSRGRNGTTIPSRIKCMGAGAIRHAGRKHEGGM